MRKILIKKAERRSMYHWLLLGLLAFGAKISEVMSAHRYQTYYQSLIGQELTSQNTIIIFDWHRVVQEQNFTRVGYKLISRSHGIGSCLFDAALWYQIKQLVKQHTLTEKIFDQLNDHYPNVAEVKENFMTAVNEEPLIEGTVELLQQLKRQGYTIYMLSNIAPETLAGLWQRHPHILRTFDGIYVPNEHNNYRQKPDPQFYQDFKEFIYQRGDANKIMLFIDDREKNVQAGYDVGIYGIVFVSPAHLKEILQHLKILEIEA